MANITFDTSAGNWGTAGDWIGGIKPGAGDVAIFDASSGGCTLDEASAVLGGLTMTGYADTLAMASQTIHVDGNAVLDGTITATAATLRCDGAITKTASMTALPSGLTVIADNAAGDENITCNSVTGGLLNINAGGTHTAADAASWDSFTLTAGTYVDGGKDHSIAGNISVMGGTLTSTGDWTMTANGDAVNGTSNGFSNVIVDGTTTMTLAGAFRLKKLTMTGGGTVSESGARYLYFNPPADDFWQVTNGTVNVRVIVDFTSGSYSTGNSITLGNNKNFEIDRTTNGTTGLTLDGDLNIGTGTFEVGDGSANAYCDLGANTITCGNLNTDTSGTATLDVGTSTINIGTTFEGSGLAVTGEAIDGGHCLIVGGTVQNVSLPLDDDALDCCNGVTNGGGCSNVWWSGTMGVHSVVGGGLVGSGYVT